MTEQEIREAKIKKMKEILKQVIIDVLAEEVHELEWELNAKDQIIEDLEKQLAEFQQKELEVQM